MVGDGVNDAQALSAAWVGVSLRAGVLDACPEADVVVTEGGISKIPLLFQLADETARAYRIQLGTTLIYNTLAGSAAALGLISPLAAALIMPTSSLTALLLSRRLT
jgi:P-type E1-E2 ATPase